ncbi:MAG TPA: succinylglutamate desuccinylase/aspartoacylase family protein [Candidatus Acidoferrales bacterium]|nr:succinylglutamate desuccinylase/aspartoacylase family protein [Candidatus Acidoferrales bacterium]
MNQNARTRPIAKDGEFREQHAIEVATLASGFNLSVPVLVVKGNREGPKIGISATIHGDEIVGVQVVQELWNSLDPTTLSGSLWLMPVANPLAFESLSRNTPLDMLDLNRLFPGVRDGWFSEQLAAAIDEQFLGKLDYYIDLHAGGTFPLVDYCYLLNDEGLSRAFLSKLLYAPSPIYPGTTAGLTTGRKIPTTVVELGGGYVDQRDHVSRSVRGVINMLRYIGALSGEVEKLAGQLLMRKLRVIRPRAGGLCVPQRPLIPGEILLGQHKLAEIISPYSFETLETLYTPFENNILVLSRNYTSRVNPGDYAFMVGDLSTATSWDS